MKRLFASCFLLVSIYVSAQPVLNSNVVPTFGTSISSISIFDSILPSQFSEGQNQIWDFSSMSVNSNYDMLTVKDPLFTPFSSDFLNAGNCMEFIWPDDSMYNYYNLHPGFYELAGFRGITNGDTTFGDYTDARRLLQFPMNFNDIFSDTYDYTTRSFITSHRVANAVVKYAGYGTLILPTGTFNNVVLVKTTIQMTDTLFYITPIYNSISEVNYVFYDPLQQGSLFAAAFDTTVSIGNYSTYVGLNMTTGIAGVTDHDRISVNLYPNPSQGDMIVSLPRNSKYNRLTIEDVSGRRMLDKTEDIENNHHMDISALAPGYYILTLKNAHDFISVNFIRF